MTNTQLRHFAIKLLEENLHQSQHIEELEQWKASAIVNAPPLQAIGRELGLHVGDTVGDKILPAILKLKRQRKQLQSALVICDYKGFLLADDF